MWFPSWFWLALTGTHLVFALKCSVTYINKANYEFLFFKENGINNWLAESQPRAKQNTGVYCFMRISSYDPWPLSGGRDHCDPHFPEEETEAQKSEVILLMCSRDSQIPTSTSGLSTL